MDLVEVDKSDGNSGACNQNYSVEENSIQVKYSFNRTLAPNKILKIIIRPVEKEDANTSVKIYRVLSDCTAASQNSNKMLATKTDLRCHFTTHVGTTEKVKFNGRSLAATN